MERSEEPSRPRSGWGWEGFSPGLKWAEQDVVTVPVPVWEPQRLVPARLASRPVSLFSSLLSIRPSFPLFLPNRHLLSGGFHTHRRTKPQQLRASRAPSGSDRENCGSGESGPGGSSDGAACVGPGGCLRSPTGRLPFRSFLLAGLRPSGTESGAPGPCRLGAGVILGPS